MKKINELCKSKHKIIAIILAIASIFAGITFSSNQTNHEYSPFIMDMNLVTIKDYTVKGNEYTSETDDASLEYHVGDYYVSTIQIDLTTDYEDDVKVFVYYNTGNGYSESNSVSNVLEKGETHVEISNINNVVESIRIDIGDKEGQTFNIESITVNDLEAAELEYAKYVLLNRVTILLFIIAFWLSVVLVYYVVQYLRKKTSIQKLGTIAIIILGMFYMTALTPFSVPDELVHYVAGHQFSNVLLLDFENVNSIEERFYDFDGFTGHYNTKQSRYAVIERMIEPNTNRELIELGENSLLSYPLMYVPQALGIAIGRVLSLDMIYIFYLGRLFNLLFFALLINLALRVIPKYHSILIFIAILPMSLQQAASYSYDGFIIGITALFVSLTLRAIHRTERIERREIIELAVASCLMAPAKTVYTCLLLLLFLIPKKRFANFKKYILTIGLFFVLAVLTVLILQLSSIVKVASVGDTLNWEGGVNYSISELLRNPMQLIKILTNTFRTHANWYIDTAFGSLLSGLSLSVNVVWIKVYQVLFVLFVVNNEGEDIVRGSWSKLLIAFASVAVIGLVLLSMLVGWTSNFRPQIEGVQGRYFIPVLLPLVLSLRSKYVRLENNIHQYLLAIAIFMSYVILFDVLYLTR